MRYLGLSLVGLALTGISGAMLLRQTHQPTPGRLVPESAIVAVATGDEASFAVVNAGGQPVRILSATSGCGRAKPIVQPEILLPGRTASVKVKTSGTTLGVGERAVPITLRTDSVATPELVLFVQLKSEQVPPYLVRADGELVFRGDLKLGTSRTLAVEVVERGPQVRVPHPTSDLPFLRFVEQGTTEREAPNAAGVFHRHHIYRVEITAPPPNDLFTGQVSIPDPWNAERFLRVPVLGERSKSIQVAPARGILRLGSDTNTVPTATFLVTVANGSMADLSIVPEAPLQIESTPLDSDAGSRISRFVVRPQPEGGINPGEYHVTVHSSSHPGSRVIVPILVRREDTP